jgi:hypothetical protein
MAGHSHTPNDETRAKVKAWSMVGVPHDDMGVMLNITAKTLRKRYKQELLLGAAQAHVTIGAKLFDEAKSGNITALIYYTKARMGWREVHHMALQNPDGSPLYPPRKKGDKTPLSLDEARVQYLQLLHPEQLMLEGPKVVN